MANEAPAKLISIGPKSGTKKDGFNLVTEKVSMINLETNQIEVELLAYDGKTVLLDVGEEAVFPVVRRNAAESLARLKNSRAIDPLVPLLEDENEMVRDTAEGALSSLGWTPSSST